MQKGDPVVWPIAAAVAGIGLGLLIWFPRWWNERRVRSAKRRSKLATAPTISRLT